MKCLLIKRKDLRYIFVLFKESFAFTLENLKTDHEGAMKMEAARYADMKEKLRRREIETEDLMKTYKKMRDQM